MVVVVIEWVVVEVFGFEEDYWVVVFDVGD